MRVIFLSYSYETIPVLCKTGLKLVITDLSTFIYSLNPKKICKMIALKYF